MDAIDRRAGNALAQQIRETANRCFICGAGNPIGLRLRFAEEGEGIAASFVPGDLFIGYEGLIHGGILAAVIDDALANIWAWRGEPAVTARVEVRFRRPVRPGDRLRVYAEPVGRRRAAMQRARATVTDEGGAVIADGEGIVLVGGRALSLTQG